MTIPKTLVLKNAEIRGIPHKKGPLFPPIWGFLTWKNHIVFFVKGTAAGGGGRWFFSDLFLAVAPFVSAILAGVAVLVIVSENR